MPHKYSIPTSQIHSNYRNPNILYSNSSLLYVGERYYAISYRNDNHKNIGISEMCIQFLSVKQIELILNSELNQPCSRSLKVRASRFVHVL